MRISRLAALLWACCMLVLAGIAAARALAIGLPGIPGIPGADPQRIAINAAAKQLAPWVRGNEPIIRDWSAVFPTVTALPGAAFSPANDPQKLNQVRTSIGGQLARSTTGIVTLAPGDYALRTRVYCTDIHRHAGHQALWIFGPLRGARAGVIAAMYAHASGKNVPFGDLQSLSWALQAGMRYGELNPNQRRLVDQLIPGLKPQIQGSFSAQVQDQWAAISRAVPGLPSFDEAISRMGDTGQTVLTIRSARDSILADANDFNALSRSLAPPGGADDSNAGEEPWSVVSDRVYERIITHGSLGSDASLEIRALGPGPSVPVPLTNIISYPPNHKDWQPLTQESPALTFGLAP